MSKKYLNLGTLAAIAIPAVTVVSCFSSHDTDVVVRAKFINAEDVKGYILFLGYDGSIEATINNPTDGSVTIIADKTSGLSNGEIINVTMTANEGWTINGKESDTLEVEVFSDPSIDNETISPESLRGHITFSGDNGSGTASIVTTGFEYYDVSISKNSGLSNGDSLTVTATAHDGWTINNGKDYSTSIEVVGLNETPGNEQNVTVSADNLRNHIQFQGENGSGITNVVSQGTRYNVSVSKSTGLSNGNIITITATAHSGWTVNNQSTFSATMTVAGLTDKPSNGQNETVSDDDLKAHVHFQGEDGSGQARVRSHGTYYDVSVSKSTGLSNGDTITVTGTGHSGWTINNQSSYSTTMTVVGLSDPVAVDDIEIYDNQMPGNTTFVGGDGYGTASIDLSGWNVGSSIDKTQNLSTGDKITYRLTHLGGGTINGVAEYVYVYTIKNGDLPDNADIDIIVDSTQDVTVQWIQETNGKYTALLAFNVSNPEGITYIVPNNGNIDSGTTVTVTWGPENGYTINGGTSPSPFAITAP